MSQKSSRLWIVVGSIVLILVGVVLIVMPLISQQPATLTSQPITPTAATALPDQISPREPKRISLGGAKAAYELKQAVFVDVRDKNSYARSHIPGALSIPLAELESRLNELDPDKWIITYCT